MYTVKVLSEKEFERLPYGRAREALGVADPKTNTAYVRYTAYPELNKYLIDHEFEHLVEEVPTDEIDGVRYKIPFAAALPAIGGALKTAGTFAATKALPAIGGAVKTGATALGKGAMAVPGLVGKGVSALGKGVGSVFNL